MRIFAASFAIEINTFSPVPTGGMPPEGLRDEILGQLRAALPVDGVVPG